MAKLYLYQRKGVRKIGHFNGRALLADEMGLGKTIQSLSWMVANKAFPTVVICPASLKLNWQREAQTHVGCHGEILEGTTPPLKQVLVDQDLFIINYEILTYWVPVLRTIKPKLVVIDECQRIKNRAAKCTVAVRNLCEGVPYVVALSGTPLTNRPAELWPVLNLLRPDIYDAFMPFGFRYCDSRRSRWGWVHRGATNLDELHYDLNRYCMIRRLKKDVLKDLPSQSRHVVPISLQDRTEYDAAESNFLLWLGRQSKVKAKKAKKAKELVRLGYLKRLAAELKLKSVIEWVETALDNTDGKLVLFGIHREILHALYKKFRNGAVLIDGKVTGKKRQDAVDRFQEDKDTRLLIGNIRAAGVGLNLTAANIGAFVEMGQTPGEHTQAEARLHRIGQKKHTQWFYLVAENTIEEDTCSLIQKKQKILDSTLDGSSTSTNLDIFDRLVSLIKERKI